MNKHVVTRMSLLNIQVCSSGTYDEALDFVQSESPAGTRNNWQKIEETDENWENLKPCKCDDFPGRTHYLFVC
jgi:hypothetical protein